MSNYLSKELVARLANEASLVRNGLVVFPGGASDYVAGGAASFEGNGPFAGRLPKFDFIQHQLAGAAMSLVFDDYGNAYLTATDHYDPAAYIDLTRNWGHVGRVQGEEWGSQQAAGADAQRIVGATEAAMQWSPDAGDQLTVWEDVIVNRSHAFNIGDGNAYPQGWVDLVPFTLPSSGDFTGRLYGRVHMGTRIAVLTDLRDRDDGKILGEQFLAAMTGAIQGALAGASVGNLVPPPPFGAIVGAIVGAVVGTAAGTASGILAQQAQARGTFQSQVQQGGKLPPINRATLAAVERMPGGNGVFSPTPSVPPPGSTPPDVIASSNNWLWALAAAAGLVLIGE